MTSNLLLYNYAVGSMVFSLPSQLYVSHIFNCDSYLISLTTTTPNVHISMFWLDVSHSDTIFSPFFCFSSFIFSRHQSHWRWSVKSWDPRWLQLIVSLRTNFFICIKSQCFSTQFNQRHLMHQTSFDFLFFTSICTLYLGKFNKLCLFAAEIDCSFI